MARADEPPPELPPPADATPPPDDATAPVEPTAAVPAEIEPPKVDPPPPPPAAPSPKPPAPPYSLPWSLRPAILANAVRIDTAFAFWTRTTATPTSTTTMSGTTIASTLTASYKASRNFGPLVRLAFVDDSASGQALVNPVFGLLYTPELVTGLRLPLFLGVAAPMGSGGGSSDDPKKPKDKPAGNAAAAAGVSARSSMDNMLFGVNYVTVVFGAGLAYIAHGFTLQGEAAVFELVRNRGEAYEADVRRTNLTTGVHVGYTPFKQLTFSVELRYQRWLTTPAAVTADPTKRDQLTVGGGIRTRIDLVPDKVSLRPGIAYFNPLDDPMLGSGYRVVVVDVPVVF